LIAFVNGRFMPLERARVSVEDRGFQFADGIYELVRTYNGALFHAAQHVARMERSARAIDLPLVYSQARWLSILQSAYRRSGLREAKLYIQITRGPAPRDHAYPKRVRPTAVVTVRPMTIIDPKLRARGAEVITVPDIRWGRCDIKSLALLPNVMARQKARSQGALEAIFVRDGLITEGSGSNVFAVIDGRVTTPPEGPTLLPGITRELVLDLARRAAIPVDEKELPLERALAAEELFLTGTTLEVMPVARVDGRRIGQGETAGKPGPIARRLFDLLRAAAGVEAAPAGRARRLK
jgi:D-alanine transaminase